MSKVWLLVMLFLMVAVSTVIAQERRSVKKNTTPKIAGSNIVGKWKLNFEASTQNEFGREFALKIQNLESYLIIKKDGAKLIFLEQEQYELVEKPGEKLNKETESIYYVDGRGEINTRGIDYKTKTKWIGKILLITFYSAGPPFAEKSEPVSRTEVSISEDGKKLSQKFSIITSSKEEEKEFERFSTESIYVRVVE